MNNWKTFNWFFWPILYLFTTINGHIFRLTEMGLLDKDIGLKIVAAMIYDVLPLLMFSLLITTAYKLKFVKITRAASFIGLLMSFYIFRELPSDFSYTSYCIFLGILVYLFFWYFRKNSIKQNSF